jgi:hypothetical protein
MIFLWKSMFLVSIGGINYRLGINAPGTKKSVKKIEKSHETKRISSKN